MTPKQAIDIAAGSILTAGSAIPESHRWIARFTSEALRTAADLVGESWSEDYRARLTTGLENTLEALPGVKTRDARQLARGIGAAAEIFIGWMA